VFRFCSLRFFFNSAFAFEPNTEIEHERRTENPEV